MPFPPEIEIFEDPSEIEVIADINPCDGSQFQFKFFAHHARFILHEVGDEGAILYDRLIRFPTAVRTENALAATPTCRNGTISVRLLKATPDEVRGKYKCSIVAGVTDTVPPTTVNVPSRIDEGASA